MKVAKSCTTWGCINSVNNGINCILTGQLGFFQQSQTIESRRKMDRNRDLAMFVDGKRMFARDIYLNIEFLLMEMSSLWIRSVSFLTGTSGRNVIFSAKKNKGFGKPKVCISYFHGVKIRSPVRSCFQTRVLQLAAS